MSRLLVHFARYGPYHHARLRSAVEALKPLGWEVVGLETAGTDATYAWDETCVQGDGSRVITVFPGRVYEEITAAECKHVLHPLLDEQAPVAIAIAGWGSPDARACLDWCRKHGAKAIVMSETREVDGVRVWWKEWIKSRMIRRFDAGLVGGRSQRDYLVKLGLPTERIRLGYNVVDNAYFAEESEKWRSEDGRVSNRRWTQMNMDEDAEYARPSSLAINHQPSTLHPPYFLASNRFVARKNLARLIDAYASYIQQSTIHNPQSSIWHLVLLGDGEQKPQLLARCRELDLNVVESAPWESSLTSDLRSPISDSISPTVFFPGFRQIEELPRFYAHAGCFIHPALEEPWGLVINEAMACGLPVISSSNVGAAEELVDDGVNGWTVDPKKETDIAECLCKIANLSGVRRAEFGEASVRILQKRCPTEAFGRSLVEVLMIERK